MAKRTAPTPLDSTGKYTVASGFSFVAGGISYGPGDIIPASVFPDEETLAQHIASGKLIASKNDGAPAIVPAGNVPAPGAGDPAPGTAESAPIQGTGTDANQSPARLGDDQNSSQEQPQ